LKLKYNQLLQIVSVLHGPACCTQQTAQYRTRPHNSLVKNIKMYEKNG